MSSFKRVAISNRHLCERPLPEQVLRLEGQIDIFILREKDLDEEAYIELARQVQKSCRQANIRLICHTFAAAAEQIGCTEIHLPMKQFLEEKNKLHGFSVIGVSVHSLEEAMQAEHEGAGYITASNIFETSCKEGIPGKGTDFLREICSRVNIPVFGLGGITQANEIQIRNAGASGACRMSDYMKR